MYDADRSIQQGILWLFTLTGILLVAASQSSLGSVIPVCKIQGANSVTPYQNHTIRTKGVVIVDLDNTSRRGFFMEMESCDNNPATSDGVFIYLGEVIDRVSLGDLVEVSGVAQEYQGMTEIYVLPDNVTILASQQPLPKPVELHPPWNNQQATIYAESLEAMYVNLADGVVVGPTDRNDQTWLVRTDLNIGRVYNDDPAGTGAIICADDGGRYEISPEVKTGDRVLALRGVLDVVDGAGCLLLTSAPSVVSAPASPASRGTSPDTIIRLATFNLADLFDTVDDPATQDSVLAGSEYQRRLEKRALAIRDRLGIPEILAVQEVENDRVLKDLLARAEIKGAYQYVWVDGPDHRGIDVALLYRSDRIFLQEAQVFQGCTRLVDGFGPDGNEDVNQPQNQVTCDSNGDQILDGNRLFSRPVLLVKVSLCYPDCAAPSNPSGPEWILLVNHWKSKTEDTPAIAYTLPRRIEEAQFVARLVQDLKRLHPGVTLAVVGDLNDESNSQPLQTLAGVGLADLLAHVDRPQRFTYNFQGRSQVLDHVLVLLAVDQFPVQIVPLHFNADYPAIFETTNASVHRSSDHDPVWVEFQTLDRFIYLPAIFHLAP